MSTPFDKGQFRPDDYGRAPYTDPQYTEPTPRIEPEKNFGEQASVMLKNMGLIILGLFGIGIILMLIFCIGAILVGMVAAIL